MVDGRSEDGTRAIIEDYARWYAVMKLIRAGGGGFLVLLVPGPAKLSVRSALAAEGLREMAFDFEFEGVKVLENF